jgi:hypothetical protein
VPALVEADLPLRMVEFHYPHTRIEELAPLAEAGTVLVPYILLHKQDTFKSVTEYYRWLLENTPKSYRYWFAFGDDSDEARAFAVAFEEQG